MSSNHPKPQKMCKSPHKNLPHNQKLPKAPELGTYEILNTNCTLIGSNNLNLDSKLNSTISYSNTQIKLCAKPIKSPENIIKKPQSPRNPDFLHNSMQQNISKFQNFARNIQSPSSSPGFVQQSRTPKQGGNFNNGLGLGSPNPVQYSNASPNYPNTVSPYNVQISSPANSVSSITSTIKSPVPSPQNIRPATPQPILPQAFQQLPTLSGQNLVQIIHAAPSNPNQTAYTNHPVLTQRTIIAPHSSAQQLPTAPLLKIKPPQNILPKPPSSNHSSNSGGQKSNVSNRAGQVSAQVAPQTAGVATAGQLAAAGQQVSQQMGQIVLPGQTMPGPALLLNQVPLILGSNTHATGGVQLILRPGTPSASVGGKLPPPGAGGPPQLVLQPGGTILQQSQVPGTVVQPGVQGTVQGHQLQQRNHQQQPQQLVRVLTANGMLPLNSIPNLNSLNNLNSLPTYIMPQVQSQPQIQPQVQQVQSLQQSTNAKTQIAQQQNFIPPSQQLVSQTVQHAQQVQSVQQVQIQGVQAMQQMEQLPPPKKKPKKKKKNKESKMDLANIMKLSGIGDEDDVLFESDASESAAVEPTQPKTPKPCESPHTSDINPLTSEFPKRIGNIHISALNADNGTMKQNKTENILGEKSFTNSQISVQQSLSDINAINQNLTQIGLIGQQQGNFITGSNHILSQIQHNLPQTSTDSHNLANILQALNSGHNIQNFSLLNGTNIQNITSTGLPTFSNTQSMLTTSNYQKFPTQNSTTTTFTTQKPSATSTTNPLVQNITSFPNFPNIQVQNFCNTNSNLILNQVNQSTNLITQNIPSFAGMGGLIPMSGNLMGGLGNFLPAGMVQQAQAGQHGQDVNSVANFGGNLSRNTTGGFKLALSEDGRLILQHDPTLNQDLQSQLLLQSIFGINLQGGNLVLTSVNNTPTPSLPPPPPPKPPTISEPLKKPQLQPQVDQSTKTTNIIQNSIPSVQIKNDAQISTVSTVQQPPMVHTQPPSGLAGLNLEPNNGNGLQTGNNPNYSYIVNLTPDQLEILKRNGQLTINGQTIFMHRPNVANKEDKNISKSPKQKTPKKIVRNNSLDNKTTKIISQDNNLCAKNESQISAPINKPTSVASVANQTIINSLQTPIGKNLIQNQIFAERKPITNEIYSNKTIQNQKTNENQMMLQKQKPNGEQLIVLQQNTDNKQKTDAIFSKEPEKPFFNGCDPNALNVEQFLTNLNINPQNLSQIISQKLSNELQSEINPKILNISAGPNAGQILAKIDISSNEMQQMLSNSSSGGGIENPPATKGGDVGNLVLPPLVSMGVKPEAERFNNNTANAQLQPPDVSRNIQSHHHASTQNSLQLQLQSQIHAPPPQIVHSQPQISQVQTQTSMIQSSVQSQTLPTLILSSNLSDMPPNLTGSVPGQEKVYQRVQTIQLTPQKQQLLKSVQLQITALSARLQQKPLDGQNPSDQTEIHSALRNLFLEQQKILATGKIIPNITQPIGNIANTSSAMETLPKHSVPVTSASKSNGTFLTSLLQQPVVSHNSAQKLFYHHGNQIITINSQISTSCPAISSSVVNSIPSTLALPSSACQTVLSQPQSAVLNKLPTSKKPTNIQNNSSQSTVPKQLTNAQSHISANQQCVDVQSTEKVQVLQVQSTEKLVHLGMTQTGCEHPKMGLQNQISACKRISKPSYSKAQLIEQQLQTDQNGAMNPDITTPFSSKTDAVKRLVRYHCYKQPVLSQKDLAKADEIFELTARHFIDKFQSMVNKYQSLLLKESMREVQTSELMMIDRMFLAEEQQSFLKLQSDIKLQNELEQLDAAISTPPEIASNALEPTPKAPAGFEPSTIKTEAPESSETANEEENDETNADFNIKCGLNYFSDDGSSDSPNFNQNFDEVYDLNAEKNQARSKNNQKSNLEKVESYNTTKIIGNFEIEINNKINNSQESFSKKFNQKLESKNENFAQTNDDYDELLCIHRELGYYPDKTENDHQKPEPSDSSYHQSSRIGSPDVKTKDRANKRASSDRNCLESLKKYRVEKHNSKVKKTGSIIGEVKFEVRIEHKKVFPDQKQVKSEKIESTSDCVPQKQMSLKRNQYLDHLTSKNNDTSDAHSANNSKRQKCDFPSFIKQEETNEYPKENTHETSDYRETFERQIDEQVQSAIDSILNLQQITSMSEKTDSQDNNKLLKKNEDHEDLDEAVKSILS